MKNWLKSIIVASLSGGAQAICNVLVSPGGIELTSGVFWKQFGVSFIVGAIMGCSLYLKQSPLPASPNDKP